MTPAELDDKLREICDVFPYPEAAMDDIKIIIQDCIEAVTPRRATEDDVNIPVDEGFSIVRNRTIDQLEANTKELLG